MKKLALLAFFVLVAACSPVRQEEITREAARLAIRPVIVDIFPAGTVEPVSDCIIDNATAEELRALAAEAVTGATAATYAKVSAIAQRPGTLQCFTTRGLPALVNTL